MLQGVDHLSENKDSVSNCVEALTFSLLLLLHLLDIYLISLVDLMM